MEDIDSSSIVNIIAAAWWPGDAQSQGISSEGIELVVLNSLDSVVKWLIICILNHIMFTYVSLPQVSEWMI